MNKHKIVLITLVTLLLILTSGLVVAFFAKNYMLNEIKPAPQEEEQEEAVDNDELAGWQTYRNEEFRFEFKYPSEFELSETEKNYLFNIFYRGDVAYPNFSLIGFNLTLSKQEILDNISVKFEECKNYPWPYEVDCEKYHTPDIKEMFGTEVIIWSPLSTDGERRVAYISVNDRYLILFSEFDNKIFDQILSTFKFIE